MDVLEYLKQEGFEFVERFNSANTSHYKFKNKKGISLIITMIGDTPIIFSVEDKKFDTLKSAIDYANNKNV